MTRDPYDFAFAGVTGKYNETVLKKALGKNITDFLLEMGTGFAYVAVEVKIGEFDFPDIGQLQGYVVAV